MEPEPGMPNIKVGRRPPPSLALLALSGAITPRMSPLPKFELSLLVCTACAVGDPVDHRAAEPGDGADDAAETGAAGGKKPVFQPVAHAVEPAGAEAAAARDRTVLAEQIDDPPGSRTDRARRSPAGCRHRDSRHRTPCGTRRWPAPPRMLPITRPRPQAARPFGRLLPASTPTMESPNRESMKSSAEPKARIRGRAIRTKAVSTTAPISPP